MDVMRDNRQPYLHFLFDLLWKIVFVERNAVFEKLSRFFWTSLYAFDYSVYGKSFWHHVFKRFLGIDVEGSNKEVLQPLNFKASVGIKKCID